MLALAAAPVGVRCVGFDPEAGACAGDVSELVCAPWSDLDAVAAFAKRCDAITFEFENVPAATLRHAGTFARIDPPALALETGQDRLLEKRLFERVGLGVHAYEAAATFAEFSAACERVGLGGAANSEPRGVVAKTRRGGYDGKGQAVIRSREQIAPAWAALAGSMDATRDVLVEQFVPFERELSLIAVRGAGGAFASYPLTQNRHEGGILRESIAPAPDVPASVARQTARHMHALMDALGYVGVLAIEFFLLRDASAEDGVRLLANEMAPRVHNSGHWTIDGAVTSQFENHVRAVLGLPLGSCEPRCPSVMVNFIGAMPPARELLAIAGCRVHDYAKPARAGRKVGHATILDAQADDPRVKRVMELAKEANARTA
jgi:5-(carboxyamino)imidazole ribonucleotide synthase